MNLDFIKFNEQIFIRGNLYRKSKLDKIQDENEKLGVRLQSTTPFINHKKMDKEFKTEHKKLVEKIRKNTRGVPDYLPYIKDYIKNHTNYNKKLKKNKSDGYIKPMTAKNNSSKLENNKQNTPNNEDEKEKEKEEVKENNPDDLFKTAVKV